MKLHPPAMISGTNEWGGDFCVLESNMADHQTRGSLHNVIDVLERRIQNMITDICRQVHNAPTLDADVIDSLIFRVEQLYRQVTRLQDCGILNEEIVHLVHDCHIQGYQAETTSTGMRGRPRYCISREQLLSTRKV